MAEPVTCARICTTCKYAVGCTLQGDRDHSLLLCEHYVRDGDAAGSFRASLGARRVPTLWSPRERPETHRGLCMDCVSNAACVLSDPEGGVWQCTEYEQRPA